MPKGTPLLSESDRQIIGQAIRELRRLNGSTQYDVAKYLGIEEDGKIGTSAQISRIEHGAQPLKPERAYDILRSLLTELDRGDWDRLCELVPALTVEADLRRVLESAVRDNYINDRGAVSFITELMGGDVSYNQVRVRVLRRRKEG